MEALRQVQVACVSGAGMDTQQQQHTDTGRAFMMNMARKQKKKEKAVLKKKLKLLKGLSKDLSTFSGMGFTPDHHHHDLLAQVRGNMISEVSEALLKQLQQLRAEEKELKRKRKQEKAKLKSSPIPSLDLESSDSESDCDEEPRPEPVRSSLEVENEETSTSCFDTTKTIQVCMGNKCKKSGGGALLEEFQRLMGVGGGAVVGCKCMGKCKNAPNVRLSNSLDDAATNPLFIGVGLEDVGGIVANFLAPPTTNDLDLSPASL